MAENYGDKKREELVRDNNIECADHSILIGVREEKCYFCGKKDPVYNFV